MERRKFLEILTKSVPAAIIGSSLSPAIGRASEANSHTSNELLGVLVDTTRCVGCRSCEMACAAENGLPEPNPDSEQVFQQHRTTSDVQYTLINRYTSAEGAEIFVKTQCMHCNQPACASACLVKAMHKIDKGPVNWETNCIGCRYCMVACPFDIPKFEYNTPTPKIQKCTFCWENRVSKGELPACVEACPAEALSFGTRQEMLEEARTRIYQNPDAYYRHIYGEHEVGGTSWMYLSAVPFEQLGFNTAVGTTPYPKLTKGFLTNIAVVDLVIPTLLLGIGYATKRRIEK
ncbi:MAG TPA: 4Fe-4S dicluster domain-containing protein [Thermodesulfobacteriota bacterium]|nr:4Fe-4S dicluster domain-containing protein [Deltaproteobacteria bacterium]HNR11933.1 4Fe-4S dicluster domain-containing protein [Thermodesulfobacteriota bacterium]HNU71064.1 4Fe-4S dicluster domain-containing protein [Thermodesulfobacteriota bacterium]HOC39672.1 4Fe-4S dicluster domain-containing protein [Thermodesulfobacteriota bacterium]HQO76918.1 4Fe-4S dicluster domain-containing protein [Thermodesulfobacteriota bacterium]